MSRWAQKPTSNYARMDCPITGCEYDGGRPQEATVPGMKVHVKRVHGRRLYDQVIWPPIRRFGTSPQGDRLRMEGKPLDEMTLVELRKVALRRGVTIHAKNKPQLLEELR